MSSEQEQKLSLRKQIKALWKPFLVIFCLSFMILNWAKVYWVFDYRIITAQIGSTLDDPTQDISIDKILSAVWNKTRIKVKDVEDTNSIEIPRIGIKAPMVFIDEEIGSNLSPNGFKKYLDRGVVHYPGSSLPGTKGQVMVLGHSAPALWPRINHDWVFSKLDKLGVGDRIVIIYNNKEYSYRVQNTIYLEKGEEMPDSTLTNLRYMLVLISCWPPGKDNRRIAVEAVML
ncbi:MAG: class E sortase [Parcubacteria group bacterium]|nr:class E sortase [Parcubacteria group bacterium]